MTAYHIDYFSEFVVFDVCRSGLGQPECLADDENKAVRPMQAKKLEFDPDFLAERCRQRKCSAIRLRRRMPPSSEFSLSHCAGSRTAASPPSIRCTMGLSPIHWLPRKTQCDDPVQYCGFPVKRNVGIPEIEGSAAESATSAIVERQVHAIQRFGSQPLYKEANRHSHHQYAGCERTDPCRNTRQEIAGVE